MTNSSHIPLTAPISPVPARCPCRNEKFSIISDSMTQKNIASIENHVSRIITLDPSAPCPPPNGSNGISNKTRFYWRKKYCVYNKNFQQKLPITAPTLYASAEKNLSPRPRQRIRIDLAQIHTAQLTRLHINPHDLRSAIQRARECHRQPVRRPLRQAVITRFHYASGVTSPVSNSSK